MESSYLVEPVGSVKSDSVLTKSRLLVNLNYGLTWNPQGREYVKPGYGTGWVWGFSFELIQRIVSGHCAKCPSFEIIFYSIGYNDGVQEAGREIQTCLAKRQLQAQCLFVPNYETLLQQLGTKNQPTYTLGRLQGVDLPSRSWSHLELTCNLDLVTVDRPTLFLMVGQPFSGKSLYSKQLAEQFNLLWLSESESVSIAQGNLAARRILDSSSSYNGLVVSGCHPTRRSRDYWKRLAYSLNYQFVPLWISRPGHATNRCCVKTLPLEDIECSASTISHHLLENYSQQFQFTPDLIRVL